MTDYLQVLEPPEYRNLAVNPGGEQSIGATWMAANGTLALGNTGVAAVSGAGSAQYIVTTTAGMSYQFGPLGPLESVVHQGAFKIPPSRQVSAKLQVRADRSCWVRVQASWLIAAVPGAGATVQPVGLRPGEPGPGFVELTQAAVTDPANIGTGGWTEIEVLVEEADIPETASHWRPLITVFSADPTTTPTAPAVGTKVWADEVFVSDSGADLSAVDFGWGESDGWAWEGEPHYSSSRTEPDVTPLPEGEQPEDVAFDASEQDANDEPDDDEDPVSSDPNPPMPEVPPAPTADTEDTGSIALESRPRLAVAEDSLTWRQDRRRIHLHGDVQLGDLIMNQMDDAGVVWLVSDIDGWWTLPEPEVPDVPRAWFDGSYNTRGRHTARTFTLTGSFVPRHPEAVAQARDRLVRACNLVHKPGWFMTHDDPEGLTDTKGAEVWLAGQPLIATTSTSGRTDFSIALRAPDPVKYGIKDGVPPGWETVTLLTANSEYPEREYPRRYPWKYPEAVFGATQAVVENRGNTVVWPHLRLAGPTNGAVKVYNVDTGQEFRIIKKLYSGETLDINCFTKEVTLNGQGNYRFYLDVDVDWLQLQPGANRLYFAEETLGGIRTELELRWRSGWIG